MVSDRNLLQCFKILGSREFYCIFFINTPHTLNTRVHISQKNMIYKPLTEFIWVFPKIGGKPPKWMVYNGKPYFLMDDLGIPLFLETPNIFFLLYLKKNPTTSTLKLRIESPGPGGRRGSFFVYLGGFSGPTPK